MLNRKNYVNSNKMKDVKETIQKGEKSGKGYNTKGGHISGKVGTIEGEISALSQTISKLDIIVRGIEAGTKLVKVAIDGVNEYRKCTNKRIELGLVHDQKMAAQAEETRRKILEYEHDLQKIIRNNELEMNRLIAKTYDRKLTYEEKMKKLNLDEKKLDAMITQYEKNTTPMIKLMNYLVENIKNEYEHYQKVDSTLIQNVLAIHNQLAQSQVIVMQINSVKNVGFDEVKSID